MTARAEIAAMAALARQAVASGKVAVTVCPPRTFALDAASEPSRFSWRGKKGTGNRRGGPRKKRPVTLAAPP